MWQRTLNAQNRSTEVAITRSKNCIQKQKSCQNNRTTANAKLMPSVCHYAIHGDFYCFALASAQDMIELLVQYAGTSPV